MGKRPRKEQTPEFEAFYASIPDRLHRHSPEGAFHIEDLFPDGEWAQIGDGLARQQFGTRFGRDVDDETGPFPFVTRDEIQREPGGNEARYNYHPDRHIGG